MNRYKTAIVTGASSGIGFATAIELAKQGMNVLATARRKEKLKQLQQNGIAAVPADIATPETPQVLLETCLKQFGNCDVLVNSAGLIEVGNISDIDVDRVCNMVRVKVEATFRMIYTFLKYFKKYNFGHVINISSVMGTKVRATAGAYAGTNFALEALSEALRMELTGTDVKISCIQPGLVMSELHDNWEVHPSESLNIKTPLQPKDVSQQVLHILNQPNNIRIPKLMILPNEHNI